MTDALFSLATADDSHPASVEPRREIAAPGSTDDAAAIRRLPAVGDRFIFYGLVGQEAESGQRMPGSGAVGWVVEVAGVSPWGSLSVMMAATVEGLTPGHAVSVGLADAVEMVRAGVWAAERS